MNTCYTAVHIKSHLGFRWGMKLRLTFMLLGCNLKHKETLKMTGKENNVWGCGGRVPTWRIETWNSSSSSSSSYCVKEFKKLHIPNMSNISSSMSSALFVVQTSLAVIQLDYKMQYFLFYTTQPLNLKLLYFLKLFAISQTLVW